jgi:transposase-like protein
MVRVCKSKKVYSEWSEAGMQEAIYSVLQGNLSLHSAAALFRVPYSTLQKRVEMARMKSDLEGDTPTRPIGLNTFSSIVYLGQ